MHVWDCTNALFASPSPGIRALGLSGNYPDGSTGNLPIIPAHIKTKPLWREHDYFTGIKSRMQEEFSEKTAFFEPFSGDSNQRDWLMQYSRAADKNPAELSSVLFYLAEISTVLFRLGGKSRAHRSFLFRARLPVCLDRQRRFHDASTARIKRLFI